MIRCCFWNRCGRQQLIRLRRRTELIGDRRGSSRERDIGDCDPVLSAFGRFVLQPRGLLAAKDQESVERLASITRVIEAAPRCWRASI